MKFLFFASLLVATVSSASADSIETLYYIGESIVTTMRDGAVVRSPYIVARTTDHLAGTIFESVISKHETGFSENTSTMVISGNQMTMTESTGTVTGNGSLTGPAWNWTFLQAQFHMKTPAYSMRIVDYNFFAEENSILAHKDFYLTLSSTPDEKLIQQEDLVLHRVDKATFTVERARLLGK